MSNSNYIDEKRRVKTYIHYERLPVGTYIVVKSDMSDVYLERKIESWKPNEVDKPVWTKTVKLLYPAIVGSFEEGHVGYWDFDCVDVYTISRIEVFMELL